MLPALIGWKKITIKTEAKNFNLQWESAARSNFVSLYISEEAFQKFQSKMLLLIILTGLSAQFLNIDEP
jgi:hypothetical protein